jgi:hypothetical protein
MELKIENGVMAWMHMVQDRVQWLSLVNIAMKL